MRHRTRRTSNGQLRLFPLPAPLRWTNVPVEARERVVALLARLLCQHARARRASEVRDE
jgi:hypothetical protein